MNLLMRNRVIADPFEDECRNGDDANTGYDNDEDDEYNGECDDSDCACNNDY
jgi:hypothetical protein